jgi:CHAT domain-containing protein
LSGKRHLFVIGGGALASLPFSVLVAEPPQGQDGDPKALRETAWLADQFALVQLPSLQSLQLLRLVAARGAAPPGQGLLGYGNPVLDGEAVTRGITEPRRRSGTAALPAAAPLSGGNEEAPLADVYRLRQLARLPGTEKELEAMRLAFPGTNVRLRMAAEATEARLKADNLTGLSVLTFATHGLLAGEAKQVGGSEPGLVLTPPRSATPRDDGLLTASEVASLRIGADWVVLSACNTASGDGSSGAMGLSGLARSFFYAGARSLLASHWPVRDDVAAVLTVEVLKQQQAHPNYSRAEALRAAMKAIRDDPRVDGKEDTWAHPSAWAPFTFVGDWKN